MKVELSIVVVEYFSEDEILKCINSISDNIHIPYEIIVSSNSCYNEEKRNEINGRCKDNVRWLFNERNGGFAYAMNEGMKVASGDFLVIMNSDCIIEEGIDSMIDFMKKHPEIGAAGPQIRDWNENIQDTARPYVSVMNYFLRQIRRVIKHQTSVLEIKMDYDMIQTVDWVIGAFIMVSRKAYELTGGLDNEYFMYAEDLDWCTRIRQNGLEIVYFPKTKIKYKGTRRARNNKKYAKIFIKSHIRFWKKFGFFYGYPQRKELTF